MTVKSVLKKGLMLTAAAGLVTGVAAQVPKSYKDIEVPKLNDVKVPDVTKITLSNGLKLYLVEDPELPVISLNARIRGGSANEPADKLGLAGITGEVMRTGGTATRTGDDLDEELESLAATVETGIGQTSGSAFMSVLKEDIDVGLEILADVLTNPEFREDKIDLAKVQARSGIARRNDDPNGVVQREFRKLIYGADSPYARHTEYETIDSITRQDLIDFHATYFHPNNTMMAVWGDFKAEDMAKKIEAAFAGWKKKEPLNIPDLTAVNYEFKPSVNLVEREDATQSVIRIGHLGIQQDNPDYFAVLVMNRILGTGGFSSRLFQSVRSRQGLAYSVGGGVGSNIEYPGVYQLVCSTKSETTAQAIRSILHEVDRMRTELVTEEELNLAKESYLNAFVFNFDTRREVVQRIMTYDYFGYPEDFLQQTKSNVEKVTAADVQRVAQEYMKPEALQILVLGKSEDFDEPFSVFGEVAAVDITIPEPADDTPEASAADLEQGSAVFAKMVDAIGGSAKASTITNVSTSTDMAVSMMGQSLDVTGVSLMVYPDKMHMILNLPFGEMKQVFNGQTGWASSPAGSQDYGDSEIKEARDSMFRDWVNLMRHADQLTVQLLGTETVAGREAAVLKVSNDSGQSTKLFVDTADFMPLMQEYRGTTPMGPATMTASYSDWREVGGIKLPYTVIIEADGEPFVTSTVVESNVNIDVAADTFSK